MHVIPKLENGSKSGLQKLYVKHKKKIYQQINKQFKNLNTENRRQLGGIEKNK